MISGRDNDITDEETEDLGGVPPTFQQPRQQGVVKDVGIVGATCLGRKMWVKQPWKLIMCCRMIEKKPLQLMNAWVAWDGQRIGIWVLFMTPMQLVWPIQQKSVQVDKADEVIGQDMLDGQAWLLDGLSDHCLAHAKLIGNVAVNSGVARFMMTMATRFSGVRDSCMMIS